MNENINNYINLLYELIGFISYKNDKENEIIKAYRHRIKKLINFLKESKI